MNEGWELFKARLGPQQPHHHPYATQGSYPMSTGQACGHLPPAEAEPKSLTVPILKGLAVGHRAALVLRRDLLEKGTALKGSLSFLGSPWGAVLSPVQLVL